MTSETVETKNGRKSLCQRNFKWFLSTCQHKGLRALKKTPKHCWYIPNATETVLYF